MTQKELIEWLKRNKNVQIDKLVNPARCMICQNSAEFWVTVDDDDNYISYYYCTAHLNFAQMI